MFKKKTNWIHVEMNFDLMKVKDGDFEKIRNLLRAIYLKLYNYQSGCFYLFEPNPHCFFAFQVPNKENMKVIKRIVRDIEKIYTGALPFLKEVYIKEDTDDQDNGQGFLTVLDAMTKFNLIYEDNSYSHIIHCCSNNSFIGGRESEFYKLMGRSYR